MRHHFAHEKAAVGTERRKHPRVRVLLDGHWQAKSASGFYQLADLSLGGCLLQAHSKAPPVGQTGTLTIYFKHDGPMSIEGEVVHVQRTGGMGLRFSHLTSSHEFQLGNQLETLKDEEYGDRFPVRAYVWKSRGDEARPLAQAVETPDAREEVSHRHRPTKTRAGQRSD